jgi:hypothetical protein
MFLERLSVYDRAVALSRGDQTFALGFPRLSRDAASDET